MRIVSSLMEIWLAACVACCCAACRDNKEPLPLEGEAAVSIPRLRDMGIARPVAGWIREGRGMARFEYRGGRMVGGYSTEHGTFMAEEHPLTFRAFKGKSPAGPDRVREVCFKPVRVAPEGYVAYMEFNGTEQEGTDGGKARPFRGEVSASYDPEGHITEMDYRREDSSGRGETGAARYVWKDGDLETVVSDVSRTDDHYERHEIYTFGYGTRDSLESNPGIYLHEMNCFSGLCDFIWYAGLWGKTTRHIPQAVTYEKAGDGENRGETQSLTFTLQPGRDAATLSYGGVPRFTYFFPNAAACCLAVPMAHMP